MIYNLLLILIFSAPAYSFNKDFTTLNDRVPLEFSHLFDAMKIEVKTPMEKMRLVGLCKDLNTNLGSLKKEHIFLLMKSEIIKNTLEYQFSKTHQIDVTVLTIKRLEAGLARKQKYLNKFSIWIWRSILAELKAREQSGIIGERSFAYKTFDGSKRDEARRFEKYLNYLIPWIYSMDSLGPAEFNGLTKEVSWVILSRLNDRSILFKRFSDSATGDKLVTLFNIPQKLLDLKPSEIKNMDQDEPMSYKEKSEQEKASATETVNKVSPEDLSPVSEDLAKELEKKTEE